MSDTPKILTMSYGSFSCRLEGFEEPFEAMTAIARHLRQLVSEDPEFGAGSPPAAAGDRLCHIARSATGQPVEADMAGPVAVLRARAQPSGGTPGPDTGDGMGAPHAPPPPQPPLVETGPGGTHRERPKAAIVAPGFGEVDGADRLFAVTETRMSHEETARRRANIAHLKAAVAARTLSPEDPADHRDTPDDHAQPDPSTQARRIAVDVTRLGTVPPTKPNSLTRLVGRAALIAQQQREAGAAAPDNPVPPGPTTGAQPDADTALHGGRFALMLDQSDAVEIEEVIDLAAAYAAAEFGTPRVARERLLRIIAHATDGSISEADMGAAFDRLVQTGRLRRVARGTFELVPNPAPE